MQGPEELGKIGIKLGWYSHHSSTWLSHHPSLNMH